MQDSHLQMTPSRTRLACAAGLSQAKHPLSDPADKSSESQLLTESLPGCGHIMLNSLLLQIACIFSLMHAHQLGQPQHMTWN